MNEEIKSDLEHMDAISTMQHIKTRIPMRSDGDSSSKSLSSQRHNGQRVSTVKLPKLVTQGFSGEMSESQGFLR